MTTLYKLNNQNKISWWSINPLPENKYVVQWGKDHTNPEAGLNEQVTDGNDKPSPLEDQIQSKINEMIARRGYTRDVPTATPDLPMLAQTYNEFVRLAESSQSHVQHFEYAYLQPKLDGVRCLATCVSLKSRRNTGITSCPHIEMFFEAFVNKFPRWSSYKFDGELYIHGSDLQTVQSAVARKEYHPMFISHLHYHVFDIVDMERRFHDRLSDLDEFDRDIREFSTYFTPETNKHWFTNGVPVKTVYTVGTAGTDHEKFHGDLKKYHSYFMQEGFEGTIIRNAHGYYRPNYRSYDLIKYKEFLDHEFKIVDVVEGKNACAVFVCEVESGKTFRVNPAYTTSRKRQVLRYKENYIDKLLTVKYEKLSREGIPLKPIGLHIRENV